MRKMLDSSPPDIFISYASGDRPRAKLLAETLAQQGWSVWWDRNIPPGRSFDEVIEEALDSAKCVVVLWSRESASSDWVKTEAAEGARRRILVPALIENVKIPLEFKRIQAANLSDWKGPSSHPEVIEFLKAVSQILNGVTTVDVEKADQVLPEPPVAEPPAMPPETRVADEPVMLSQPSVLDHRFTPPKPTVADEPDMLSESQVVGFFKNPKKRAIFSLLGGTAIGVAGGIWWFFPFVVEQKDVHDRTGGTTVTESGQGIPSVGGTIINTPVSTAPTKEQTEQIRKPQAEPTPVTLPAAKPTLPNIIPEKQNLPSTAEPTTAKVLATVNGKPITADDRDDPPATISAAASLRSSRARRATDIFSTF